MDWQVEGEASGKKIDMGPLVGVKRGLLTMKRIQGSGGLSGVELVRNQVQVTRGHASTLKHPYVGAQHSPRSTGFPRLVVTSPTLRKKLGGGGYWREEGYEWEG